MTSIPNEGEFVQLYAKHQGYLLRYVTALVPHLQDAEDVLGEVAVALWKNFAQFEEGTSFSAWARQIAHHRVLEYYRVRNRRFVLPELLIEKIATDFQSRGKIADHRLMYLAECKEELSFQDRELIEQRYVDDLRVQDIAKRLGKSENSISKSLGRIRRILLTCIERRMKVEKQIG